MHRGHVNYVEDVDRYGKVVAHHKAPPTPLLDTAEQSELLTLPVDFDDCASVPVFTRIIAHAVYYDGEHENLGLVRMVTPDKPGGVWVYFHALMHQESQLNAAGKMQQYLLAHSTICAQNYFHPFYFHFPSNMAADTDVFSFPLPSSP